MISECQSALSNSSNKQSFSVERDIFKPRYFLVRYFKDKENNNLTSWERHKLDKRTGALNIMVHLRFSFSVAPYKIIFFSGEVFLGIFCPFRLLKSKLTIAINPPTISYSFIILI